MTLQPRLNPTVVQGEIRVNPGCYCRNIGTKVQEWTFDLVAKWPEIDGYGSGAGSHEVYLGAGRGTLYPDKSKAGEPTWIAFRLPKGWSILSAKVSKYTCSILVGLDSHKAWKPRKWKPGKTEAEIIEDEIKACRKERKERQAKWPRS
jgi:hypothetical protein